MNLYLQYRRQLYIQKVLDRMYDGDRCESTLSIVRNELKRNTIFYRTPSGLAIFIDFALTFSSAFTSNG